MQRSAQITSRSSASGRRGAVAAARRESVDAATRMLELGGNAVDAAVAAGLVAGVVEPMETTLAGSGFMLVHVPGDEAPHSVEFAPRAPSNATADMFQIDASRSIDRGLGVSVVVGDENVQGARATGIPATIAGLIDAHERFGRLSLPTVFGPAIEAAHDGFAADAYYSLEVLANLKALRSDPGCAATFLVDGDPVAVAHLGETTLGSAPRVRQAALGRTLEVLAAQGAAAFRQGEIGDALAETVQSLGGILARDDLREAMTWIGKARPLAFRDQVLWGPNAPCGTVTEFEILQIWKKLYPQGGPLQDTPARLEDLAAASWHAFADRYHWLGDTDVVSVPEAGLLSDNYAAEIAAKIRRGESLPRPAAGEGAPWEVFASRAVNDPWAHDGGAPVAAWQPKGATKLHAGTTHVSVIDADGMAVSLTHTAANHFGSKVLCERTGFLLDAAMGWFNALPNAANSIAGRKRPLANMGPVLLTRNGEATAALGAPGGRRIIAAVVQVALNLVERGMSATEAVAAPRIDASGPTMLASRRLADVIALLDSGRIPTVLVEEEHQPFGYEMARPVLVTRDAGGNIEATTDPFAKGFAVAL